MPHGKLDVYVEGAVKIKDPTILGKGTPYCTLQMGTQEKSSPPIPEGGTHPYFNTYFEFRVDRLAEQLMVKIFSKKTMTNDELLGSCTIVFKQAFYQSHEVPVTAYTLTRPSGRPGGQIRLSLTFKEDRRPAAPPHVYVPPLRTPGPYRQPRPPPPGPQYRPSSPQYTPPGPQYRPSGPQFRQPRPPSPQQQQRPLAQNFNAGPSAFRSLKRDSSSQSSDSDSNSDSLNDTNIGDKVLSHVVQEARVYEPRGRRPPGPLPGPRPRPQLGPNSNPIPLQGIARDNTPPPQPPTASVLRTFGGGLLQDLGGALVGSSVSALLTSEGDGFQWGGGEGEGGGAEEEVEAFEDVETADYASAPEEAMTLEETNGAAVEIGFAVAYEDGQGDERDNGCDERDGRGDERADGTGAPTFGPNPYDLPPGCEGGFEASGRIRQPLFGRIGGPLFGRIGGPLFGRIGDPLFGRAGPPMAGQGAPRGRRGPRGSPMAGRGPPRGGRGTSLGGRGPPMRGRGPPMRGRGPPAGGRGTSLGGRGPPVVGRGGPPMAGRGFPNLGGRGSPLNIQEMGVPLQES